MTRKFAEPVPPELSPLGIEEIVSYGRDSQRGNLVGIQPFMIPSDYASEATFQAKVAGYVEAAQDQGWLNSRTVVVLPEYIGAWLVAAHENDAVYQAPHLEKALRALVWNQPLRFLRAWLSAQGSDRLKDGLFRMKGEEMAAIYQSVFSRLAANYAITLVAGSIVLPSPRVLNGRLTVGKGALYNITAVYRPDGSIFPELVHKVHPITDELPFTARAAPNRLPVFNTSAGRLGVLICADSWYRDSYLALKAKGCQLIAVPNNLLPGGIWRKPWGGYNPGPAPSDVDLGDIEQLSEGEAWCKYALAGRIQTAGASQGIHVFLHGQLWDMEPDGHTILVGPDGIRLATAATGAALVNFWIE